MLAHPGQRSKRRWPSGVRATMWAARPTTTPPAAAVAHAPGVLAIAAASCVRSSARCAAQRAAPTAPPGRAPPEPSNSGAPPGTDRPHVAGVAHDAVGPAGLHGIASPCTCTVVEKWAFGPWPRGRRPSPAPAASPPRCRPRLTGADQPWRTSSAATIHGPGNAPAARPVIARSQPWHPPRADLTAPPAAPGWWG